MAQAVTTLPPFTAARRQAPGLRELGIYELPDKRRFVVSTLHRDGRALYPARTWAFYGNAEYWLSNDGRLLSRGTPTKWSVADLKDTGESATYPKARIL
jgi:hypothetical protein